MFLGLADHDFRFGGHGHGILLTSDGGNNWIPASRGLDDSTIYSFATFDTSIFVSTALGGIYRFDNQRKRWIPADVGLPDNFRTGWSSPLLKVGGRLIADIEIGLSGLYVWSETNSNWSLLANSVVASRLAASGNNVASMGRGINLSTNFGDTWIRINDTVRDAGDLGSYGAVGSIAMSGRNLFVSINGSQVLPGVYLTTDQGVNWSVIDSGSPDRINAIVVSGPNLVAGSTFGLWLRKLSEFGLSAVDMKQPLPNEVLLAPNPTNGRISLKGATGDIRVTNVLGEIVIEQRNQRAGDVTLDLSNQPSGTYFVRITSAGSVMMRKVVKE